MAIPAAAAIAGGASIIGNIIGQANSRGSMWASIDHSNEMYARQRADALADRAFENEYNSPRAQMARLKEAGLNPALVYGHGAGTAVATSANAKPASAQGINPTPFRPDTSGIAQALTMGYDIELRQAQIDNVKADTAIKKEEAQVRFQDYLLRQYQVFNENTKYDSGLIDLRQKRDLYDTNVEMQKKTLESLKVNMQNTLNEEVRKAEMHPLQLEEKRVIIAGMKSGIVKTEAEVKNIQQNLNLLKQSGQLNDLELFLKQRGLTWYDDEVLRTMAFTTNMSSGGALATSLMQKLADKASNVITRGAGASRINKTFNKYDQRYFDQTKYFH